MNKDYDLEQSAKASTSGTPTAQELKGAIDSGRTGDKVSFPDPGAAPLGTDDEAAGTPDTPSRVALAIREETRERWSNDRAGPALGGGGIAPISMEARGRPLSPNLQIYRPQLTSVLSIVNRITGVLMSLYAVGLVAWLLAAATGSQAYFVVQAFAQSWLGQIILFGGTFAFFLHLCGGIRHLVWDAGYGFDLRTIYISGWTVVAMSVMLTLASWIVSFTITG
jgi:succinate dehydrogenase / fumarate reductase cytochrome b subunit